jgi:superfamily II DNA or RNA helicase
MTDPFNLDYSDNDKVTVADRLAAEIRDERAKLDVATGFLTPSVWGILGGPLTELGSFRLLLGKDFELAQQGREREEEDIRALVREALIDDTQPPRLPLEEDAANIHGLLELLRRDTSDVRVWTEGFLHAKAYLLERSVGVGSANFTAGGLQLNRELVAWRRDYGVVRQVQEWFDRLWDAPESAPYKDDLIAILERTRFGSHPWTPYDVLIRTLAERYGIERPASLSQATFQLRWFQEDAVYRLIRLLNGPARGALLADAVGLGKTYMALGVIHHYLYQAAEERKGTGRPVLLIVPASLQGMWERELEEKNLSWACHIVTVQSLREGVDLTKYVGADLVVIDEAHRLRSGAVWFQQAMRLLTEGAADKRVLLLTATPVHTSLRDLTNLLRVMTKNRRAVWAPAIADFERYLKRVEKQEADPFPLLDRAVVRRSRSDLIRAYEEQTKAGMSVDRPSLPRRKLSHVTYSYVADGDLDLFEKFVHTVRDLHLAPYDLERFRKGALEDRSPPPPSSLVGLYVAGLLKRWESSLRAVRVSLLRLETLLRRFLETLSESPPRVLDLSHNPEIRKLIEQEAGEDEDRDDGAGVDDRWAELIAGLPALSDPESYDLDQVKDATAADLKAVASLLGALPPEDSDGKVAALLELLTGALRKGPSLKGKRALIFTQYADTAKYLADRLSTALEADLELAAVHGDVPSADRARLTAWFDPDRASHVVELMEGAAEPTVLISTDVLAEGHNLQLASAVVNFELHWNPQVVVQRSGRIDRLNSPHREVQLISFMPDEGIDAHLDLVRTLNERFGLIHFMGLGDEPVTPLPSDMQTVTFEQLRKLYADEESVLDEVERRFAIGSTDFMRAPLEQFLIDAGEERLREIPVGVQSVRHEPKGWRWGPGVFMAFKFEEETIWRFYQQSSTGWGSPVTDELALFQAIACARGEPRVELGGQPEGPGGVIDWDLLRKAAREVADEITRHRATADIARGASERSRKLRQDLRQLASAADYESGAFDQVLERLEQVRVEDFDVQPGWRAFEDGLRAARRETSLAALSADLDDLALRGLEILGPPEDENASSVIEVDPASIELVSWEWLIPAADVRAPSPTQEALHGVS